MIYTTDENMENIQIGDILHLPNGYEIIAIPDDDGMQSCFGSCAAWYSVKETCGCHAHKCGCIEKGFYFIQNKQR